MTQNKEANKKLALDIAMITMANMPEDERINTNINIELQYAMHSLDSGEEQILLDEIEANRKTNAALTKKFGDLFLNAVETKLKIRISKHAAVLADKDGKFDHEDYVAAASFREAFLDETLSLFMKISDPDAADHLELKTGDKEFEEILPMILMDIYSGNLNALQTAANNKLGIMSKPYRITSITPIQTEIDPTKKSDLSEATGINYYGQWMNDRAVFSGILKTNLEMIDI